MSLARAEPCRERGHFTLELADMRIALVAFDFGEYTIHLANALARQISVTLFLPEQESSPQTIQLGPAVDWRPFRKPRLRQLAPQLQVLNMLRRQIEDVDPQVVHLQQGHLWFNLALPLLKQYPLVLTVHDPRHHVGDRVSQKTPQGILDFGFQRADQLVTHSEHLKRDLVDRLHLPEKIIHVIPHIALGTVPSDRLGASDGRTILFFGRIWEYKGLEYLIRAEPLITERVPGARIVIAGEGEDMARYRRLMIHPDRFVVHNAFIPEDQRAALFEQATVVVLPYIDASQSGVIPVACTFGKPVVATTVGGLPELVDPGHTGYLVPPRDEQALADAVIRLLTDPELRREMGANARRKAETELSSEAIAAKTIAVYEKALARARETIAAHPKGESRGLGLGRRLVPRRSEHELGSHQTRSSH